jgi:UDP-perosamine 4-acetyltransferase
VTQPAPDLLIIGGGGHCKVVLDVARTAGFNLVGILDPHPETAEMGGVPVLGGDDLAPTLLDRGVKLAFVALGSNALRRRIGLRLREMGFQLPCLVHPTASISPTAALGAGVVVMPQAVINAQARVGEFAIVNSGAIIEHDCVLGDAAHAAPGSVIGGHVTLGEEVLFGIGARARAKVRIGSRSIVGVGAAVVCDIADDMIVAGVPARPVRDETRSSRRRDAYMA